jgi:hypothetical protein
MEFNNPKDSVIDGIAQVQSKIEAMQANMCSLIREVSVKRDSLRSVASSASEMGDIEGAASHFACDIKTPNTPTRTQVGRSSVLSVASNSTAATEDDGEFCHSQGMQSTHVAMAHGVEVHAVGLHVASKLMHDIPWARVLVIRKLHKLGFDAPNALVQHLREYGNIEKIILLPSRRKLGRMRPSSTGFVIFESADAAQALLSSGEIHCIRGVGVELSNYQEQSVSEQYPFEGCFMDESMYL